MDLKIKDVAELLSVSETTIRRWLSQGKIPAYRINGQYRFSRIEIEDWVMNHKLGQDTERQQVKFKTEDIETEKERGSGSNQFSLYRAINKGGVYNDIPGNTKEDIIKASMNVIAKPLELDSEVMTDLLLDREKLMPTSLNNGIGVPHTRDFLLPKPFDVVTIVFPEKPIEYGALDDQPIHTLFFLMACKDKRHLHLLAKIAHLCSQEEALDLLRQSPNKKDLLDYIKNWESSLNIH